MLVCYEKIWENRNFTVSFVLIDYFIEKRLESGGWQGVACCLAKINYLNDDYYEIDGYGNLKEFTFNDAKKLLDYIEEEINNQEEED